MLLKNWRKIVDKVLENIRLAIQEAENFGLVRTESGQVITGAIESPDGVILTEN
jgi:hypothetical protein